MFRRWAFATIVLVLLIAALAIPESRRVLRLDAWRLLHLNVGDYGPEDWINAARRSHASLGTDWETYLALAELGGSKRPEYYKKAIQAGPNRPETYAAALTEYSQRSRYTRSEVYGLSNGDTRVETELLDPELGRAILELAKKGSRVDPDNAFFDLIAADALYGMQRDTEALNVISAAARKSHYNSYRQAAAVCTVKYLEAAGLPSMEANLLVARYTLVFPHLAGILRISRLTVWHARQLDAQGRSDEARDYLTAIVKIGVLMRKGAEYPIERLVGSYTQSAIGLFEPTSPKRPEAIGGMSEADSQRLRTARVSKVLRAHGWPDLAALLERESASAAAFKEKLREYFRSSDQDVAGADLIIAATMIGLLFLRSSAVLLVIAGLVWLALKIGRRDSAAVPKLSRAGKIGLVLLGLLPWFLVGWTFVSSSRSTFGGG